MIEVRNNQIWQDADPRIEREMGARRLLRVVAVGEPGRSLARVVSWYEKPDGEGGWMLASPVRPSTIKLERFKPTSTGYRLIEDAP